MVAEVERNDLHGGFSPDVFTPAHTIKRCRQDQKAFRPNVSDTDYEISPSTMINAIFLWFYGRFKMVFQHLSEEGGKKCQCQR